MDNNLNTVIIFHLQILTFNFRDEHSITDMNIHVAVKVPNVQTLVNWQKAQVISADPDQTAPSPIRVFTVCYSDKRFCESKTQQTVSFVETWPFPLDPKCSIIQGFH